VLQQQKDLMIWALRAKTRSLTPGVIAVGEESCVIVSKAIVSSFFRDTIRPIPKACSRATDKKKWRKKGATRILTDRPVLSKPQFKKQQIRSGAKKESYEEHKPRLESYDF